MLATGIAWAAIVSLWASMLMVLAGVLVIGAWVAVFALATVIAWAAIVSFWQVRLMGLSGLSGLSERIDGRIDACSDVVAVFFVIGLLDKFVAGVVLVRLVMALATVLIR